MMPAAKHGDPQMGVDIHLCVVPPSPSPVPLPTPHMSIVFDPFDYVPYLGATVTVCGMKRATAGTNATVIHIPPGFPFAPKLPDKDDELFMGSKTVVADGDPFSFISVPCLGCQVVGMPGIPRLKKKGAPKLMLLPTTFNLAIPTSVFIGGPPTISLMGMLSKLGFAALGKFAKSALFKRMRQKLFGHMKPGFLKCMILRAEPVNILNGAVSVDQEDFNLPGRIPIQWIRSYSSSSSHIGVCGPGWETLIDIRLEVDTQHGNVLMLGPQVGPLSFERLPLAEGEAAAELELSDGARLSDYGDEYRVLTKDDRIYHFPKQLDGTGLRKTGYWAIGRITDLCGNALDFEYSAGRPVAINESAGRRLGLIFERDRLITMILQDPISGTEHTFVRYEYDAVGDLVAVIDTLGAPYRFAYDAHHLVCHTDRNGLSFYYEYDKSQASEWRVNHAWGDGGLYDYRFEYLDAVNERRITDSLGNASLIKLDERGLPISEIDPLSGMTIYEYDDVGRTTAVIDPGGHRTAYEYDERGNQLKLTRADGKCIETTFDAANKAVAIVDPNGAQWQQKWDVRGLLVEQTTPLGNTSRYEYDIHGQLVALTNPRGASTELGYDGVGNLASLRDALGHRTLFTYDLLGNITCKLDSLNYKTLYRYDAKGRIIHVRHPAGGAIGCDYDAEDNLVQYVDGGSETKFEYFGQGEIARRIQPDGYSVQYHYNTEERLIGITNQRGETYQLNRDALGRIVEEVDYWGQSRHYAYDASGYLISSTDPLERTIKYSPDALGRILKKMLPDGFVETFTYDGNGNLVEIRNAHSSIEREFDPEGRLIKEVQGAFTIKNTYDANSNRVARETTLGNVVAYEFDALDQAVSIRINQDEAIRIERDAIGRIAHESLSPNLSRRFQYNADGYLTEHAVSAGESPLFATRFDYNLAGNLIQRSDSQYGADGYHNDPMGRITEHLDPQRGITRYLNDPAGDRLRTRIVESRRQRIAGGREAEVDWSREGECDGSYYCFDRAGNLVDHRGGQGDLHLVWDANQRLIESHANGTITCYGYDPLGRRLFKEMGYIRTQFFWDGDALVGESVIGLNRPKELMLPIGTNVLTIAERREKAQANTHQKKREYVYYPETFEPLALIDSVEGTKHSYHYHNDSNGCPTRLTNAKGEVKWAASYTAWGQISKLHISEIDNPVRLQGQYEDEDTGLHYNRHRYYDAKIGQFISQDPLGIVVDSNTYQISPTVWQWIDPLGLSCRKAKPLPSLDITGKVHGDLPRPKDLSKYLPEDLGHLLGELRQSVQTRINSNITHGFDKAHAARQAAEQQLIRSIEKHLAG